MGDGTEEKPFTREDVLKLIEENGGKGKAILFKKGKKVKTIEEKDFLSALMAEVERF